MATASLLEQLTTDLTSLAQQGKLDPVVGRDTEIEQLIEVLSRPENNCAVLVGDRGVGKRAIVEGLAHQIADGTIPNNKHIREIDLTRVMGRSHLMLPKAADEDVIGRLKLLTPELDQNDLILFMAGYFHVIDANERKRIANYIDFLLNAAVHEYSIPCIYTMEIQEFEAWQEANPDLSRQFQPIYVNEPSPELAIQMLEGIKNVYEDFHHLKISHDAIEAAVRLSVKFVQDRKLPDTAIDLMDKGAATLRKSQLEAELAALQPQIDAEPKDLQLSVRDIAEVVAKWTDRPVSEIMSSIE